MMCSRKWSEWPLVLPVKGLVLSLFPERKLLTPPSVEGRRAERRLRYIPNRLHAGEGRLWNYRKTDVKAFLYRG